MVTHDNRREATGLYLATIEVVTSLAERAELIAALADRRVALVREDDAPGAKERARQLRDHVRAYVIPRARALESPLLVVLLGPTGAGKSTLMNTLARATVSRTGVLRPTTREAVLLSTDADAAVLRRGALAGIDAGQIVRAPATTAATGMAIVDAPDLDSVERANRVIADALAIASAGSRSRGALWKALSPASIRSSRQSRRMSSAPQPRARPSARSRRSRMTPSSPRCSRSCAAARSSAPRCSATGSRT